MTMLVAALFLATRYWSVVIGMVTVLFLLIFLYIASEVVGLIRHVRNAIVQGVRQSRLHWFTMNTGSSIWKKWQSLTP